MKRNGHRADGQERPHDNMSNDSDRKRPANGLAGKIVAIRDRAPDDAPDEKIVEMAIEAQEKGLTADEIVPLGWLDE